MAVDKGTIKASYPLPAYNYRVTILGVGEATVIGCSQVNGLDMAHGGLMFTLADVAFALACNTRNAIAVGNYCSVQFLRPASRGARPASWPSSISTIRQ